MNSNFITDVAQPVSATKKLLNPLSLQRNIPLSFYTNRLNNATISKSLSPFDRRVTCIEWHSHSAYSSICILGSKGGDLVWWDPSKTQESSFIHGKGAGGSITNVKFHPTEPNLLFTTSIDGTLKKQDFDGKHTSVYLDTMNKEKWYTALDAGEPETFAGKVLLAGSNTGELNIMDLDGNAIWSGKTHKGKLHDVEFHPLHSHTFATAGHDKLVKVWDIRKLKEPTTIITHDGILNSIQFSKVAPHHLLATLQNSECKVYDIFDPKDQLVLQHPHRPFQHLTPIKAVWHPCLPNLFLIGRYPQDPQDKRTVDCFQITRGSPVVPGSTSDGHIRLVSRSIDTRVSGIHCLVKLNLTGDLMLTCSGQTSYVWSMDPTEQVIIQEKVSKKRKFEKSV